MRQVYASFIRTKIRDFCTKKDGESATIITLLLLWVREILSLKYVLLYSKIFMKKFNIDFIQVVTLPLALTMGLYTDNIMFLPLCNSLYRNEKKLSIIIYLGSEERKGAFFFFFLLLVTKRSMICSCTKIRHFDCKNVV